jgi:hypothetical protein
MRRSTSHASATSQRGLPPSTRHCRTLSVRELSATVAPNKLFQPRSLPPVTSSSHCSAGMCGRAPAERRRWASKA